MQRFRRVPALLAVPALIVVIPFPAPAQVEQLKAAVEASERADNSRLEEMHKQVLELEMNIARARTAPLDIGSSAQLLESEQAAREEERRKWRAELDRVHAEGAKLIEEARERGKAQYRCVRAPKLPCER